MPQLNRVFEEMKVKYRDRKIPEKILKSVEDKAAKVSKSAADPVAAVRAESRKRKEADALKVVTRTRKVAKTAMDSTEEVAESAHDEVGTVRPIAEASQP